MKSFMVFVFSFLLFMFLDFDSFASTSLRLKYHHYNDNLVDGAFNYDLYTRFHIPYTTRDGWETINNLTGNLDTVGFLKHNHKYRIELGGNFDFYHQIDYITGNTGGNNVRDLYIPFVNEFYMTIASDYKITTPGIFEFVYDSSMGDFPIRLHASYGIANNYSNDYELTAFCISGFVYDILIEDLGPVSTGGDSTDTGGGSTDTGGDSSDTGGDVIDYRPNLERIEEGIGDTNDKLGDIEKDIEESNNKLGDIDKSISDFNSDYREETERQKEIDSQIGDSSERMKDDLEKFQDDIGASEGKLIDDHMGSLKDLSFSDGFTDLFNNLTFPLAATASLLTALFNVWETDSIFTFSFILLIISVIIGMRKLWR